MQKNDTVEVASEKERFSFGADKNPLKMVEVSACCSNVCIQNFVRLFEQTVSDNGEGLAVGRRRQVSIQTTSSCLRCIP